MGATDPRGQPPPVATDLGKLIANEYLGPEYYDEPLSIVAELAISEASLPKVQRFIASRFQEVYPSDFHRLIPTFKWAGLASTNFDLVVERAYENCDSRAQELVPFLSDEDAVEEKLNIPDSVAYLKLHGCITRVDDPELPLILTPDQYVTHKNKRKFLFKRLGDWGINHPLIFVGHRLRDPDIRQLLLELGSSTVRPMYYIVMPEISTAEERLWASKRVTPIRVSFEDFLTTLDSSLNKALRRIRTRSEDEDHPIYARRSISSRLLSYATRQFLESDVLFLNPSMQAAEIDPQTFYQGFTDEWGPIEKNFDVRRTITDTILSDVILADITPDSLYVEFALIKGSAGSGKSVLLRRLAWDTAFEFDRLALFVLPHGRVQIDVLRELHNLTNERIFLFVDNVAERDTELSALIQAARASHTPLTVIGTERYNEWNLYAGLLPSLLTDEFE
ncbi:MAG: SIR2 family protein, partial [Nitrososphaera sp.]|nr:SIR2 family protein [Nitrososphaera sp.]